MGIRVCSVLDTKVDSSAEWRGDGKVKAGP